MIQCSNEEYPQAKYILLGLELYFHHKYTLKKDLIIYIYIIYIYIKQFLIYYHVSAV